MFHFLFFFSDIYCLLFLPASDKYFRKLIKLALPFCLFCRFPPPPATETPSSKAENSSCDGRNKITNISYGYRYRLFFFLPEGYFHFSVKLKFVFLRRTLGKKTLFCFFSPTAKIFCIDERFFLLCFNLRCVIFPLSKMSQAATLTTTRNCLSRRPNFSFFPSFFLFFVFFSNALRFPCLIFCVMVFPDRRSMSVGWRRRCTKLRCLFTTTPVTLKPST